MGHDKWSNFIHRATQRPAKYIVVTAEAVYEDITCAERILGKPLSPIARTILVQWKADGAKALLDVVPRVINPNLTDGELIPSGMGMSTLFPAFQKLLDETEELAILIESDQAEELLIAGAAAQTPPSGHNWSFSPDGRRWWAYFLPKSYRYLMQCEAHLHIHLSAQMRQLFMRAWGVPGDAVCPYFYRPDELIKGALYTELYRPIADQIPLSNELIEQQLEFVMLSTNSTGDSIGFFANEGQDSKEYPIYLWDHGTTTFETWALDFAGAVARLIADDW
jgi:hypothetical protein